MFILYNDERLVDGAKCDLFTPFDFRNKTPVILVKKPQDKEFQLFKPTGSQTKFPTGTKFGLGCTGVNNYLDIKYAAKPSKGKKTHVYAETSCTGKKEKNGNEARDFSKILCRKIPTSSIRRTNQNCGVKGLIHEVGFIIENKFYGPILTICYDHVNKIIFYTNNTINGAAIDGT